MRYGRLPFSGLTFFLIFLVTATAYAERINYTDGKARALSESRILKAYEAQAESAEYERRQAVGGYLPRINVSENWINTKEPGNAAFAKMAQGRFDWDYFQNQIANPDRVTNFKTKLEIVQPVLMNGQIHYRAEQSKSALKAAQETATYAKQGTVFNFTRAFFGLALADKALSVSKASKERTEKYHAVTEDFFNNGLVVKSDLLVAETRVLMNTQGVEEAEKNLAVAESQLQRILGTEEEISIIWEDPEFLFEKDLEKYISLAEANRQDLKAMTAHADAAEMELKKAKSSYLPEVVLFADYQMNDDKIFGDNGEGYTVGAQMNLNLFKGGSDYYKIKAAKSAHLSMLHRIADKKLEIKNEVKDAYYTVIAAETQLAAAKKRVESAYSALEITENRFREGLSKVTEVLDRDVDAKEAELSLYFAEYNLIIAKAQLNFAAGILN